MALLTSEAYIPFSSSWATPVGSVVSILIALRWNSREFVSGFLQIIYGFISFKSVKRVSFEENMVADVWTSFAKPLSQSISSNHLGLRLIIFT